MHRVRQNYNFNGCKPSKLLALKLKQSESRATINGICTDRGIATNPKEITATFQSFYSKLYESSCNPDPTQCRKFLKELNLPLLDPEEAEELGQPIMLEELQVAILCSFQVHNCILRLYQNRFTWFIFQKTPYFCCNAHCGRSSFHPVSGLCFSYRVRHCTSIPSLLGGAHAQ